jgi:hypothetical protein
MRPNPIIKTLTGRLFNGLDLVFKWCVQITIQLKEWVNDIYTALIRIISELLVENRQKNQILRPISLEPPRIKKRNYFVPKIWEIALNDRPNNLVRNTIITMNNSIASANDITGIIQNQIGMVFGNSIDRFTNYL